MGFRLKFFLALAVAEQLEFRRLLVCCGNPRVAGVRYRALFTFIACSAIYQRSIPALQTGVPACPGQFRADCVTGRRGSERDNTALPPV